MSFKKIVEKLQNDEANEGFLILIRCGIFFEGRGMHKPCLDVHNTMKHLERTWKEYYILKMDVRKYFQNIDKMYKFR